MWAHKGVRRTAILLGVLLVTFPFHAHAQSPSVVPADNVQAQSRGVLVPLYVSFAALQALDVQSTTTALARGGREANPVMAGVVESPVAFVALKAATGAAVIYASEKMRRRSRIGALVTMAVLNGLYTTIVMRNYAVSGR